MGGFITYGINGEIVAQGYDGDLDQCKQEVLSDVRAAASTLIEKNWPIYRQLNILRSGNTEQIAVMSAEIDSVRNSCSIVENTINSATTHAELYSISWSL